MASWESLELIRTQNKQIWVWIWLDSRLPDQNPYLISSFSSPFSTWGEKDVIWWADRRAFNSDIGSIKRAFPAYHTFCLLLPISISFSPPCLPPFICLVFIVLQFTHVSIILSSKSSSCFDQTIYQLHHQWVGKTGRSKKTQVNIPESFPRSPLLKVLHQNTTLEWCTVFFAIPSFPINCLIHFVLLSVSFCSTFILSSTD